MNVNIAGMGWVTPLGRGLDEVALAIEAGTPVAEEPLESPKTGSLFAARAGAGSGRRRCHPGAEATQVERDLATSPSPRRWMRRRNSG